MPEYINHNGYTVHLAGPDGSIVHIRSRQRIMLSDYFDRYRIRGFIKLASDASQSSHNVKRIQAKIHLTKNDSKPKQLDMPQAIKNNPTPAPMNIMDDRKTRRKAANEAQRAIRMAKIAAEEARKAAVVIKKIETRQKPRVVGRESKENPNNILSANLASDNYPISNNIGVGILSYNRYESLKRCVDSIYAHTDLTKTTVFISDDGSDDERLKSYLKELQKDKNIVVIRNDRRLGIAGNTNRLLRCLSRFGYGLLLNDDVEVLKSGWERLYPNAMSNSGLQHFIFRMPGIYGAKIGDSCNINSAALTVVYDKPQGAVLAFTRNMLDKCGYFDEAYGLYGMEHVDWSTKAYEFGLQPQGYYDVLGSDRYFRLNNDTSAVSDRQSLLRQAKVVFDKRELKKCSPSDDTKLESVSYIIPFRDTERTESILTVVNNIRAQKYPVIDIHLVEQDADTKISLSRYMPVNYKLVVTQNSLFNKSRAFNQAAIDTIHDKIIMHDADILAPNYYTRVVCDILNDFEACHIGKTVIYANRESTDRINDTGIIDTQTHCERMVGYYEGGSLACTKSAYWTCGAFNEDFWGYGCEDCDFYARLSATTSWYEQRSIDFLHLFHGRVPGWDNHHKTNKEIERNLRTLTIGERIRLSYEQCHRNGYGEHLERALGGKR